MDRILLTEIVSYSLGHFHMKWDSFGGTVLNGLI